MGQCETLAVFNLLAHKKGYSFTDLGAEGCCRSLNALYIQTTQNKSAKLWDKYVCIKALYILILQFLQRKLDIGANKRQSIFETIAGIDSRHILYLVPILVLHKSRTPPRIVYGFLGSGQNWYELDNVLIGTIGTVLRLIGGIGLALTPLTFQYGENRLLVASHQTHSKQYERELT